MTREWKPDDEALVRVRVVPGDEPDRLHVQVAGGSFAAYVKPEQLIEPGVVIPGLTREDADLLSFTVTNCPTPGQSAAFVARIRDAIRAQTPEPEPPPRYFRQGNYLHDRERGAGSCGQFLVSAESAQAVADWLNAQATP